MIMLKTKVTVCAISIIAICAFVVQSASAQTAYRCTEAAVTKSFTDAHCKTSGTGPYGHLEIPTSTSTAITLTNITTGTARSTMIDKSVQSGVTLELQANKLEGDGTLENLSSGGVMWAQGTAIVTVKEVFVTSPPGKGCKVSSGKKQGERLEEIESNELIFTTKGLTNQLKLEPGSTAGGKLWRFWIEGCSTALLNHEYTATGSVIGNTEGATTGFAHNAVTTQNSFKLFGQKTGTEGFITLKSGFGEGIALT